MDHMRTLIEKKNRTFHKLTQATLKGKDTTALEQEYEDDKLEIRAYRLFVSAGKGD